MKAKTGKLAAVFSEADRRLVAVALETGKLESEKLAKAPAPLNYRARIARMRQEMLRSKRERRLRAVQRGLDRWTVELESEVDVMPVGDLYLKRQINPAPLVRRHALNSDFVLCRLKSKVRFRNGIPVSSLRLALEFSPYVRGSSRRAMVWSVFPVNEGRKYHGTHVYYGLRPNLSFWVPLTPKGDPFTRLADIGPSVRQLMLFGPARMAFRKVGVLGAGSGSSRAEWILTSGREVYRVFGFETWFVLQYPKGRRSLQARATVDAGVPMPGILKDLTGETRHIRSVRDWELLLPKPTMRAPERAD